MPTTTARDGVYLDVKTTFADDHARGASAARVMERIRSERAGFVVLNFHETDSVPSECLRLLDSILDDESSDVRIILTETSYEIRRTFVDDGMLSPAVLHDEEHGASAISMRPH